jgi:hypothetical protein
MDNVIENRDAHYLPGLGKPFSNLDILAAWLWVAGRMVVREQYCSRTLDYGRLEDFARMNERRIKRSNRDLYDTLNPVFCVQTCNDELLLVVGRMLIPIALEKPLGILSICDARPVLKGALIN